MLTNRDFPPNPEEAKRQLRLVVGDGPPTDSRAALERWVTRRMADAFVAMRGDDGRVPSEGIYDIRRNHRRPWRTLLRRIDEAVAAGVPHDAVAVITETLEAYHVAARKIAERELRGRPTRRRAAAILLTLALGACAHPVTEPKPTRPISPKAAPSDTGAWITTTPAVRP